MAPRLKNSVIGYAAKNFEYAMRFYSQIKDKNPTADGRGKWILPDGGMRTQREIEEDISDFAITCESAKASQTILFSADQCEVFCKLLEKGNIPPLEYRLPFRDVILEFTRPVTMFAFNDDGSSGFGLRTVLGLLLSQHEVNEKQHGEVIKKIRSADEMFGFSSPQFIPTDWSKSDTIQINHVGLIDKDFDVEGMAWSSQSEYTDLVWDLPGEVINWRMKFRSLAIACIGYINCENIYLHREGAVPESVNAKRERKGKSRLEPYYICRIRGVNYDNPQATGQGAAHSIRYDVRGHFRRLTNGKTTWVRPHQRGLANELYVPKTYLVDKRVQP